MITNDIFLQAKRQRIETDEENDVKITDGTARVSAEDFEKGYVVVRKGKKIFRKIVIG